MKSDARINESDSIQPELTFPKPDLTTSCSMATTLSPNKCSHLLKQYHVLLWKSFLIRRRHPFLLCAEMIFPILFVTILAVFRSQQSLTLEPACHVQSQSMPSMGLLHYLQSMVCNFNYTCHPTDPDLVESLENFSPLIYLLHNLTELAKDSTFLELLSDPTPFEVTNFLQWTLLAPKLLDLYAAYSETVLWVTQHYPLVQSKLSLNSLKNMSNLICGSGSNLNDIWRALQLIEEYQPTEDAETEGPTTTTPVSFWDDLWDAIPERNISLLPQNLTDGQRKAQMWNLCGLIKHILQLKPIYNTMGRLRHFLFGRVAYYPSNKWTDTIVKQADSTSDLLKQLRYLTHHYFNTTRPWLVAYLSNPSSTEPMRQRFVQCAESDSAFLTSKIHKFCKYSLSWLDKTTINQNQNRSVFSDWSTTLDQLDLMMGVAEDLLTNCFEIDNKFVPFQDLDSWLTYLNSNPGRLAMTTLGLILNSSTDQSNWTQYLNQSSGLMFQLTIRKEFPLIDGTFKYKVLDRYWNPRPRRDPQIDMKYFTSGFIDLQEQISQTLVEAFHNQTSLNLPVESTSIGIQMKLFPSGPHTDDKFIDFFSTSLPQLMIMTWVLSIVITVKYLVDEKEDNMIDIFYTFGIPKFLNQLAWLTSSFLILFVLILPVILILKYGQIIPLSNFFLILLFLSSYVISCLGFALLLSTFFRRSNLAAIMTGIVYFLLYLPAPLLLRYESQFSHLVLVFASLIPQIGYSLGWSFFTRLEVHGTGAQWTNLWFSGSIEDPFCLGLIILLLWLTTFVYVACALLLNRFNLDIRTLIVLVRSYKKLMRFRSASQHRRRETRISKALEENYHPTTTLNNRNNDNKPDTPSSSSELDHVALLPRTDLNPTLAQPTITVQNVSKRFWFHQTYVLNDICLGFQPNQITALLGPNGAGKTTLISILVGLLKPTQGKVRIHNHETTDSSNRKLIGYCPQHDILYDNLTVLEHIHLFGKLKNLNMAQLNQQVDRYLLDLGFSDKRHALAKTLSGGQKRKLSLFLAFMGPTSVVILDEPTAGLDPLSKGAIWDLLKLMRSNRTIILSSHHMRETELLADQIAVLSKGQLCMTDSLGQLYRTHNPGYRIAVERHLDRPNFDQNDVDQILSICSRFVPDTRLVYQYPWKLILGVPSESSYDGSLVKLFDKLESEQFRQSCDVSNMGLINIPLDEIFLDAIGMLPTSDSLGKEDLVFASSQNNVTMRNPNANGSACFKPTIMRQSSFASERQIAALLTKRFLHLKRNKLAWIIQFILPCLLVLIALLFVQYFRPKVTHPPMHIHPWLVQTKRIPHLLHFYSESPMPSKSGSALVEFYRPIFRKPFVWTGTRCLDPKLYSPIPRTSWGCLQADQFESEFRNWPDSTCSQHYRIQGNATCRQLATKDLLINLTGYQLGNHLIEPGHSTQFIGRRYGGLELAPIQNAHLNELLKKSLTITTTKSQKRPSVWLKSLSLVKQLLPPSHVIRIWYNNKGYTSAPAYLNLLHNLQLRLTASQTSSLDHNLSTSLLVGLAVITHPLVDTHTSFFFNFREALKSDSLVALFLLLAFSFIPTNFILLLIYERRTNSKHLQYLAGLRPFIYWSVNLCCDFLTYALSALVCVLLLVCFQKYAYVGLTAILPFCLIIFLYGSAMLPFVYLLSFLFSHPSTGFVFVCALNLLIGCLTTTISFFLQIVATQYGGSQIETVANIVQNLFRLCPHFCLGSTIYDLAVHRFLVEYGLRKSESMNQWQLLWPNMIFLAIQSGLFFGLVLSVEYRIWIRLWTGFKRHGIGWLCQGYEQVSGRNLGAENSNTSESAFVRPEPPIIQLDSVSKIYSNYKFNRNSKPVLSNLSFSIPRGQCFGLLGSNGAGKSTTFGILSGEISPSKGTVRINGCDTTSNSNIGALSIGYCPQQDGLHSFLTVQETLTMYAHFHLIPPDSLPTHVTGLMAQTGLTQYASCLTSILSGGNKRKLSTAIAFLGNPDVILLDEPSNGMDLLSKKLLWANIDQAVRTNKSAVLLSSHYMDECELLCQRIGLLDQGRLHSEVCQPMELRRQFAHGSYLIRMLLDQGSVNQLGLEQVEQKLQACLPDFRLRQPWSAQQECTYSESVSLARLFDLMRSICQEAKLITYFQIEQSCLEDILVHMIRKSHSGSDSSASEL